MQLTNANVGDIFLFPYNGSRILIEELTKDHVIYTAETGERYASKEQNIDARRVLDQAAIAEFKQNAMLGQSLEAAEKSTLRKILGGNISAQEKNEAIQVLGTTRKQRQHFVSRVTAEQTKRASLPSRLSDIINAAESRRTEQKPRSDYGKTDHSR